MYREDYFLPTETARAAPRCICGELAVGWVGWPFPHPVCDGSKPLRSLEPFAHPISLGLGRWCQRRPQSVQAVIPTEIGASQTPLSAVRKSLGTARSPNGALRTALAPETNPASGAAAFGAMISMLAGKPSEG